MAVEVFKTDVGCPEQSASLVQQIRAQYPDLKINFDLEDCDRILRVEGVVVSIACIIRTLNAQGFNCEELT